MDPLFDVYHWDDDFDPEAAEKESGTYYVITGNGIFISKKTKAGTALVPVQGLPWLKKPDMNFRMNLPKVPVLILSQALTFFRQVFEKYNSESYVTIFYSEQLNKYMLWCPKQTVTHASVDYDRTDQPEFKTRQDEGWAAVGTIHSHCDFSAFHSGTDVHDEDSFDGIHITLGHVNKQQISIESSLSFNGNREKLDPEACCEGLNRVVASEIKKSSTIYASAQNTHYFDIELDEESAQQLVLDAEVIKNEWMPKVTKEEKKYFNSFTGKKTGGWLPYTGYGGGFADDDDYMLHGEAIHPGDDMVMGHFDGPDSEDTKKKKKPGKKRRAKQRRKRS